MADPYQPINVSTGSAQQAIQATPNVTPNLENLMQGITSGMISLDDLRKRAVNIPLETAQRESEIADIKQVAPLKREAEVAQLQNIKAKQQFEAESLPLLNDTKREALKQQFEDVMQHGVPSAVQDLFNKTVPGFVDYDNAKLFPKSGGYNSAYALDLIHKAFKQAEDLKEKHRILTLKPTEFKSTNAKGESTTTQRIYDQATGKFYGTDVVTETKAAETGKGLRPIQGEYFDPATNEMVKTVQTFDLESGQLQGNPQETGREKIKLTKEQADAMQFSGRMGFNNQVVANLSTQGFDPTAASTTVQRWIVPNRWQSGALQSYTAAKDNWITAALRKESGAAIANSEYAHANKEYFPQDGDTPAVVAQKAALRQLAEEDIKANTPNGGFWAHSLSNPNRVGAPAAPGAIPGAVPGAATTTGVAAPDFGNISDADLNAQVAALPKNVPAFIWKGTRYVRD